MLKIAFLFAVALLSACGGGGLSGSSSNAPPANQSVGGIWQGTNTDNGVSVKTTALVAESGQFYSVGVNLSNNCAVVLTGSLSSSGSNVSGSVIGAVVSVSENTNIQTGCAFQDGSTWATGTVTGTVAEGSTITLTGQLTTANGTALPGSALTLSFNSLYNQPSSLTDIAGNWTGPTGLITTIHSDGTFFEQDPSSGCVVNGQYSIIDATHNVYSGSATYASCQGSAAVLNGLTAIGLATLNTGVTPNEFTGGVSVRLANGAVIIAVASDTR